MVYCAVVGCLSNNNKKSKTVSSYRFFTFPKNKQICSSWIHNCYQQHKFNVQTARICSKHFLESDYCMKEKLLKLPLNKWKLKPDAIPSLHLGKSSAANTQTSPENKRNARKKYRDTRKNIFA